MNPNNIPQFHNGLPPEYSILVLQPKHSRDITHLLEIVINDGKQGIKTDKYWLVSTSTQFMEDGTVPVVFYNQLMLNSKNKGYGYIQFTI